MPRDINSIPNTADITNTSGTTLNILGVVLALANGDSVTIDLESMSNGPRQVERGATLKERVWQAIVSLEAEGHITLDATDPVTVIGPDDQVPIYPHNGAVNAESNVLRPGLPGYFADRSPATLVSAVMGAGNAFIDLTFDKGIYPGAGAIDANSFVLVFDQNGGTATDVDIVSVKKNNSAVEGSAGALTGGETVLRVFLNVTGTEDGNETIQLTPVVGELATQLGTLVPPSYGATDAVSLLA